MGEEKSLVAAGAVARSKWEEKVGKVGGKRGWEERDALDDGLLSLREPSLLGRVLRESEYSLKKQSVMILMASCAGLLRLPLCEIFVFGK